MPFDLVAPDQENDVPSCKIELSELKQQVLSVEEVGGDMELGTSTVSRRAYRVECENMEAEELVEAERAIEEELRSMGDVQDELDHLNGRNDLVMLTDKSFDAIPEELKETCEDCAEDLGENFDANTLWLKLEDSFDSDGLKNNRLSLDDLTRSLGLGESFEGLPFSQQLALSKLIRGMIEGVRKLKEKHSKNWDKKKNESSWFGRGLGKLGLNYADMVATKPTDSLQKKLLKNQFALASGLITGTEALVTGTAQFFTGIDVSAKAHLPSEEDYVKNNKGLLKLQTKGGRIEFPPPALKMAWGVMSYLPKTAIATIKDPEGQALRNHQRNMKIRAVAKRFMDPDMYSGFAKKMSLTYEQKGLSGSVSDVGHTFAEFFFVPAAGVNAAGKLGKLNRALKSLDKINDTMGSKVVRNVADETTDAVQNITGARKYAKAIKKARKDKTVAPTLKSLINKKLGRNISEISAEELTKMGHLKQSWVAVRRLLRGHHKREGELEWMAETIFSFGGKKTQKVLSIAGTTSGLTRKIAASNTGRAIGKAFSTVRNKKRKPRHEKDLPEVPNNRRDKNRPSENQRRDHEGSPQYIVSQLSLGKHQQAITKQMKQLSEAQQKIWTDVLIKTGKMSGPLQAQVYGLMARLPKGVEIGRLTDRGFEMIVGSPPRNAVVDLTLGIMFSAEAGQLITAGTENLGFSISAENIPAVQLTGALLRGTWASSAAGVGKAFQRMRGFNFELFTRQIYPTTAFTVLGGEALQGWENLQINANKPINEVFADMGLMKNNGALNIGVLKDKSLQIRNLASVGGRIQSDYESAMTSSGAMPLAA